jgi:hypothetical protein
MNGNVQRGPGARGWVGTVLRDIQFWIPLLVLVGGLFVLRWIH